MRTYEVEGELESDHNGAMKAIKIVQKSTVEATEPPPPHNSFFTHHPKYRYSEHTILFRRTLQASLPALRFFLAISSIVLFIVACVTYFLERGGARCVYFV